MKYPDIAASVPGLVKPGVKSVVLDCEAVAFERETGKILPFQVLHLLLAHCPMCLMPLLYCHTMLLQGGLPCHWLSKIWYIGLEPLNHVYSRTMSMLRHCLSKKSSCASHTRSAAQARTVAPGSWTK